ncbi:MAG TPA: ATP-binding protein [Vicinamibacterales bacterium]
MFAFLLRDLWVRLILLVWLAVAALYLLPTSPPDARRFFGDYLLSLTFLPFVIAAVFANVSALESATERRFWQAMGGAFLVWFAYGAIAWLVPDERWTPAWSVAGDCAFLGYYLLILLGIELKPHLQSMNPVEDKQRRLRSSALMLLLFAWLCYLVVIPAAVDRAVYESELPSFLLYLSLDALIVVRLLWVRRQSWSVRWATLYGLLALGMTWQLTADALETLHTAGVMSAGGGTLLDLWWTVPFVLLAAAARARHAPFAHGQDVLNQDWGAPARMRTDQLLMAGAVALPIVHHGMYALGAISPQSAGYRQALVEATLVALAALALVAFRLLDTERRGVEQREQDLRKELDQARRMDAVARVAGALAHDFNNLLHVIGGRVELASETLAPSHPAHEDLREIRSAAMRASAMAGDLLTFGRRHPVSAETVSLHAFVDSLRRQLKLMAGDGATLTIHLRAAHDLVAIDPMKFERVLLNLVANARNAMPEGGRIEIETWNPPAAPGAEPRAALAVRDTGQGMPPEVLEQAFEPFFTTRRDQGGSGMGLSSAHGIVQAMGGSIRAESEVGAGTSVVIELPVVRAAAEPAAHERPRGALLIVETDPHMRQMLRGYFADVWKPVLTTASAMEALQIAGTSGQRISILITDTAPSGLTYDVLIAKLRDLHPALQVVLIAPEDFTGAPEGCLVMREPLSLSALADEIRSRME